MKTANKKTAAAKTVAVSVVREPLAIDQMFQRNSLGYLESSKAADISLDDAVGYVVTKLDAGQSAMRDAILFAGWLFKSKPEAESKAFGEALKARWSGSTPVNLLSIAKALPSFENKGLAVDKVRDLYGLREVSKLLKDGNEKALSLLNKGESPRAVKKACDTKPPVESEPSEENTDSQPINIGDEVGKLESLLLSYTDKFAKLAEHEERLKIARQVIAKLNLGGYLLMHADAAAAVQTLKAKK
jgi:hypothetical protein